MEELVELGRGHAASERLPELVVALAHALGAWAVAGGECGRLVPEEELGVVAGAHDLAAATLELEPAVDPALELVGAADVTVVVVEEAAVAEEMAAGGVGDQLAEGSDSVLAWWWWAGHSSQAAKR